MIAFRKAYHSQNAGCSSSHGRTHTSTFTKFMALNYIERYKKNDSLLFSIIHINILPKQNVSMSKTWYHPKFQRAHIRKLAA